jgi:hypothetical protein
MSAALSAVVTSSRLRPYRRQRVFPCWVYSTHSNRGSWLFGGITSALYLFLARVATTAMIIVAVTMPGTVRPLLPRLAQGGEPGQAPSRPRRGALRRAPDRLVVRSARVLLRCPDETLVHHRRDHGGGRGLVLFGPGHLASEPVGPLPRVKPGRVTLPCGPTRGRRRAVRGARRRPTTTTERCAGGFA